MKRADSIKNVLLILALFIFNFEAKATQLQFPTGAPQDSLVLKNNHSERKVVIRSGEKVKVWLFNKTSAVGKLKSLHQDTLTLLSFGKEKIILVHEIEKIKVYAGPVARLIGGALTITGVGGMFFGGISLVVGTVALFSDNLGAVILIAVPVLFGGGYAFYKGGRSITGRRFDLNSEWWIKINRI